MLQAVPNFLFTKRSVKSIFTVSITRAPFFKWTQYAKSLVLLWLFVCRFYISIAGVSCGTSPTVYISISTPDKISSFD